MAKTQFIRSTKEGSSANRYEDLLEISRLVSWCMNRDYLVKTCLDHISQRLGMRARCVLKEGEDLKLNCWVGKYECPMEQVPVCKESIVWRVVESGTPINLTDPSLMAGYHHTLKKELRLKPLSLSGMWTSLPRKRGGWAL